MSQSEFITRLRCYHSVFQQGSGYNVPSTFYVTIFQFISPAPEAAALICQKKKKKKKHTLNLLPSPRSRPRESFHHRPIILQE